MELSLGTEVAVEHVPGVGLRLNAAHHVTTKVGIRRFSQFSRPDERRRPTMGGTFFSSSGPRQCPRRAPWEASTPHWSVAVAPAGVSAAAVFAPAHAAAAQHQAGNPDNHSRAPRRVLPGERLHLQAFVVDRDDGGCRRRVVYRSGYPSGSS